MYCVKCKTKTDTNNITEAMSRNNRKMLKGTCAICFAKKSTFVKGNSLGKGIVSNFVGKIPLLGQFLSPLLEKIGLGIGKSKTGCMCDDNNNALKIIQQISSYISQFGENAVEEKYTGSGIYLTNKGRLWNLSRSIYWWYYSTNSNNCCSFRRTWWFIWRNCRYC